jgi:hypothetical protein
MTTLSPVGSPTPCAAPSAACCVSGSA